MPHLSNILEKRSPGAFNQCHCLPMDCDLHEDLLAQPPELTRHSSWPNKQDPYHWHAHRVLRLQRSRSDPIGTDAEKMASAVPALEILLRRALRQHFARALATQEQAALPALGPIDLKWATNRTEQAEGIEAILFRLEQKLTGWVQDFAVSSREDATCLSDEVQQDLQEARAVLSRWSPQCLASVSSRLHARVFTLCAELEKLMQEGSDLACDFEDQEPSDYAKDKQISEVAHELSREQREFVDCPRSIFVQGRSGTGKTLVITRRMLSRRAKADRPISQVFVTKSSLLRNEVAKNLEDHGVSLVKDWPPSGVVCATWEQLVDMLGARKKATLNFNMFLESYWPRLRGRARQLPAQLVWAEFNTRLRPFGSLHKQVDLTLEEYLENDVAAVGIRLEHDDQLALYDLFKSYKQMKQSSWDDIDAASWVLEHVTANAVDELYVDEAQDFAPLELMVLIALCRDPDGVTVAGDTCQTINPGSSFSFHDIIEAFHRKHRGYSQDCHMLTLHYNYRCSPGVASLAGAVVQFLLRRFPFSADYVREKMLLQQIHGLPLVAELPGVNLDLCIKGTGELPLIDSSRVAILVRSHSARQQLRNRLGAFLGIPILTVAESKGLEFELVLLCNFLSDCPDNAIWNLANDKSNESKVISRALGAQDLIYGSGAIAKLENKDHRLLCRMVQAVPDLKNLYVAITRARAGCAILEDRLQPEVFDPLVSSWHDSGLVERWSSLSDYLRGVALEHDSTETMAPEPPEQGPEDAETMIDWISGQLVARLGQSHKKARNLLAKERGRLRGGGNLDRSFREKFEALHGVVQGQVAIVKNTSRPSSQVGEVPSILPFL